MTALKAAVQEQPGFTVLHSDPAQEDTQQSLLALQPEVIFIEEAAQTALGITQCCASERQPQARTGQETTIITVSLQSFVGERQPQQENQNPTQYPIHTINELIDLLRFGRWPNRCR
jgi:hypothetical protein